MATIDTTGQVQLWNYTPSNLGQVRVAFMPGNNSFKLTQGTPVKMVGFNKAGGDHYQSQDLAVVYSDSNDVLALAELNHATNTITTYAIGGHVFVDMIAGDFDNNGREDIAVITADANSQQYYLNVLLSQDDGSTDLIPYVGNGLPIAANGVPQTTMASIRVIGGQEALLWSTASADGSTTYINAALVTGGQMRVSSGPASLAGHIAAISAGSVGTPATFAIYSSYTPTTHNIPAATGTVQVNANGEIAISEDLTQYGGSFSGFDVGVTGITPAASTITSGIVYNDVNSNGIQDPGESGLPGVTVRLIGTDNAVQTTMTSDGSDGKPAGSYSFENVPSGAYLQVLLPPGTWTAENPPPGVSTNANGSEGIVVGVTFVEGQSIEAIGFTDGNDNPYSVAIKSADLQNSGQQNLVVRTSSALFVQRFQTDGTSVFDTYDVSSPAAFLRPQLHLEDINADGRIDIVTSGQSGIDVFLNIDFGEFRPFTGLLADKLTNTPNGVYSAARAFSSDLDSNVTSARTYTHVLNWEGSGPVTVNGVQFQGAGRSGTNYSLVAFDPLTSEESEIDYFLSYSNNVTGELNSVLTTGYVGTAKLVLSGLTPGTTYTTTFYSAGDGAAGGRQQTIFDSEGGISAFDENIFGDKNGLILTRTYTATSSAITFYIFAADPQNPFLQAAVTNEIAGVGFSSPVTFTDDDDSGIAGGMTYTHLLNFAATDPVTVGAVTFAPVAQSGPNWSLVGYDPSTQATPSMSVVTAFNNNLTGNVNSLATDFYYPPVPGSKLTLTGLAVGATYTATWYGVGFQQGVQRVSAVDDSLGGSAVIDENLFGSGNGIEFSRTFAASNDTMIFTFVAADPNTPFHHYAVTNQLVPSGDYAGGALNSDAGSGISSSKTYTHVLNWEGAAPITVNGLEFQGAARSGTNYSLVAIDPHTLAESEIDYFLSYDNNVSGQLNSIIATGYVGAAKLVLSGLTPGTTYMTTFYTAGDGTAGGREQTISDSEGGAYHFDQNTYGNQNGFVLTRTYTATSDSITFYIIGDDLQNPFQQAALTNEVVPGTHQSPPIFGTEVTVVPASSTAAVANVYAVQQNTQLIYELAWDTATSTLASTGRFFPIDRLVTRLAAGSIVNEGELDFVIYENSNAPGLQPLGPGETFNQKLWVYTPGDSYTTGTELIDLGTQTYKAEIDLLLAPIFPGVQTVVFMGVLSAADTTDVVTYRAGSGSNSTALPGIGGFSLGVGQFVPGSRTPNILVAGPSSITALGSGINPNDAINPNGPDPSVPLVILGTTYTPNSFNAAAVGASGTTYSDDLIGVRYDQTLGFTVLPYFNITGGFEISGNAGGALYDFPVVIPGSAGGTINGNVFYDTDGNGQWSPSDPGVYNGVMVYLDLNNNGQWDPNEPRTFPDTNGDYQFSQLLPQAYTVALQAATGYTLTTASTLNATVPALPGAEVNGIDFGVKTKDFGTDLNNDGQSDLLLTDPKEGSVYVQLRSGLNRCGTYKVGTLPSADWSVVGICDFTGNGRADILIVNSATGELQVWEFFPGPGTPAVARIITPNYVVPPGNTLVGVADLNTDGRPELILRVDSNGTYRTLDLQASDTVVSLRLNIPAGMTVVAAGDLDGDGESDLLLQDDATGHLVIDVFEGGKPARLVDIGQPDAGWSVAGMIDLLQGTQQEIIFQEVSTGRAFAWTLTADLQVSSVADLDIGTHDGLRVHLAPR